MKIRCMTNQNPATSLYNCAPAHTSTGTTLPGLRTGTILSNILTFVFKSADEDTADSSGSLITTVVTSIFSAVVAERRKIAAT